VIKKVDKSAGIVVMDKTDYENKILQMLSDINKYSRTDIDDTTQIQTQADNILRKLHSEQYITKKQLRNLTDFTPLCPTYYGIPKILKPNNPNYHK